MNGTIESHKQIIAESIKKMKQFNKWGWILVILMAIPFLHYIGILIVIFLYIPYIETVDKKRYSEGFLDGLEEGKK